MGSRRFVRRLVTIAGAAVIALFLQASLKATGSCSDEWVLCASDSFDFDGSTYPGVYIESENGTGRLGLSCIYENSYCSIYTAVWLEGYGWSPVFAHAFSWFYPVPGHLVMDSDGNLEVWDDNYSVLIWDTGTDVGDYGAHLIIGDDGCANIYNHDESTLLWSSGC